MAYDIGGINPPSPLTLNPGNSQSVQLVAVPKSGNSIMVTVVDTVTGLPIHGATVELAGNGYDQTIVTGEGYLSQTDWSGGSGQTAFGSSVNNKFAVGSSIDTTIATGTVVMAKVSGVYTLHATSTLESSTFDTGTSSNFISLAWKPVSQPLVTGSSSVLFQFATKPTSTSTFQLSDYLGPDGTHGSYFNSPGSAINTVSNNNQFARYMAYFTTQTATVTPSISDVTFAYATACTPPGQVLFQNLSAGQTYTLTVRMNGYQVQTLQVPIVSGWQQQTVMLAQ